MRSSPLDRYRLAFLIGVPLAWAVLLAFHGAPDPDDVYGSLSDEATRFLIVHVGGLLFIGLIGVALDLLVQDLPRPSIGPSGLLCFAGAVVMLARSQTVLEGVDTRQPAVADGD